MTRLLLVDDHVAFMESLAEVLRKEEGFTVVAQATTLREASSQLEEVDVAIVDLVLPDGSGADLIAELRRRNRLAVALVLTGLGDRHEIARAVVAGACGYLEKTASLSSIVEALHRVADGQLLMGPEEVRELFLLAQDHSTEQREAQYLLSTLTEREREVLEELCKGGSDKEIAARLNVTPKTVRTHVVNILGKLGVHSRLQAVIFALRHGRAR